MQSIETQSAGEKRKREEKKMKKGYLTAAAAAALSAAMAFGAWAASFQSVNQVMYVNASSLNVRTEPSTTAGKAQSLSRGTAVQVNGLSGDWARISLGGKNYYVSSRYLSSGNSAAAGTTTAASTPVSVPEGVTVSDITVSDNLRFASSSKIKTGTAKLYKNTKGKYGDKVICVNAGHGTKGGERVKTLSHPDGSPKVTGGTNQRGAVESMAVSSGMTFQDGTAESTVTLQEALILRDVLLQRGFSVLMIRESSDVQLDNIARTVLANNYAACHIAIHWDSTTSDKGAYFMSVPDGLKKMDPVSSTWQKSEAFGEALIGGLRGRGVKIFGSGSMDVDLTQTSYSTVPSIDIELGDKVSDHSEATLRKLAEGLADGVTQYFTK